MMPGSLARWIVAPRSRTMAGRTGAWRVSSGERASPEPDGVCGVEGFDACRESVGHVEVPAGCAGRRRQVERAMVDGADGRRSPASCREAETSRWSREGVVAVGPWRELAPDLVERRSSGPWVLARSWCGQSNGGAGFVGTRRRYSVSTCTGFVTRLYDEAAGGPGGS